MEDEYEEDEYEYESEAAMCENWGEYDEDGGGDYCDYLTWRYGIEFAEAE